MTRRLSICYVVPGHDLMSSMGPTRNVLSLAQALGRWADVTVAFRRVADAQAPAGQRVLEIEPAAAAATVDDSATSGIGYGGFLRYLGRLRSFTRDQLASYDVVLEKGWLLSGYVSAICARRGQVAVPIENIVQNPRYAARGRWMKHLRMRLGSWIAGRGLRAAPMIIAETEFLRSEIAQFHRVPQSRVKVVDLGVDRDRFHPSDVTQARRKLGIALEEYVLTYVGVLDLTHNLEPVIRALALSRRPDLVLEVVGDGERRSEYQQLARDLGAPVRFRGKVPHAAVPDHIAAADLCLAPYDAAAFASGELGYSTMKIPEYLSCGRAVVTVPSGRTRSMIEQGVSGFLLANQTQRWQEFLMDLPTRERVREMGVAAARVALSSWDDTARAYHDLLVQLLARRGRVGG